jgi:hypothetical protein
VLNEALGLLDDHLGDLDVAGGGLVEGGGDDLSLDRTLHVGDFFGALVDEQDDEDDLRVVRGDGVGDGLQKHGLASTRRRDDEAALAFADWGEQVHDPAGEVLADGLHLDALLGIERGEVVEEDLVSGLFGRLEVDGLDLDEREVLLALVGRPDVPGDGVAGLEIELADLGGRDVDVVRAGQVVVVGGAEEAVTVGEDLEDAFGEDVALFFALGLKNLEDEVLLAEAGCAGDVERASQFTQLGDIVFFQFCDCHGVPGKEEECGKQGGTSGKDLYSSLNCGRGVEGKTVSCEAIIRKVGGLAEEEICTEGKTAARARAARWIV